MHHMVLDATFIVKVSLDSAAIGIAITNIGLW
jgi:hypothetical protein